MRELGVNNLDHRLQQSDIRDQALQPLMPTSTPALCAIGKAGYYSFNWL